MQLHAPFSISSRLLPALKIGDVTVSLKHVTRESDGRDLYRAYFDNLDGKDYVEEGLRSGCQGGDWQEMFASLLSFLSAAAESMRYERDTGKYSDNVSFFAMPICEWAENHADHISMLSLELEESANLIVD